MSASGADLDPRVALKEWAAVVLALETGAQDVVLRRGGIAEDGGAFRPEHARFWLFPTYFHQQVDGVRADRRELVERALAARPDDGHVVLASRARVRRAFEVADETALDALAGRHVYARDVALAKLHARHGQALYALELEVERVERPVRLALRDGWAGCRSWVDLDA